MRPIRSASVLVPSWHAMEFLERVLDALAAQETTFAWDVLVIDSGSRDGTLECLARRRATFPVPFAVQSIPPAAFDHGDTRNLLAARSRGELLVFLTQDAIPSSPQWLATLARNFDDPAVGAAYCRNVARDDCWVLTRVACLTDPGYALERAEVRLPPPDVYTSLDAHARRVLYNFNDVASAVRRELWERHPFPRTMMGEDVLMARAILEAGYTVVYDAAATVDHSHDYEPLKQHWRGEVDARFNAEWLDRVVVPQPADVPILAERLASADLAALRASGMPEDECAALRPRALELRRAFAEGLHAGSTAPRRFAHTAMRGDPRLAALLFLVDAPEGVLAHALELGRELLARGHRVVVCHVTAWSTAEAAEDGAGQLSSPAESEALPRRDCGGLYGYALHGSDDRASARLERFLAEQSFDVAHVFGRGPGMALVAEVAWRAELPFALSIHDLAVTHDPSGRFGLAAAAADLCIVPSVALAQSLAGSPGLARSSALARLEPRRIVPCVEGVDVDAFRPRQKTRARRARFGVFGKTGARDDAPSAVLRATRGLPADTFELRHVPEPHELRPADLDELFAELDVVVAVPEELGANGRIVQHARAHATAVVVTAGVGLEELVRHDVDGLVVPAGDIDALTAALRRFVDDPTLAPRLAAASDAAQSLRAEAAELEFRYRGMACLGRDRVLPSRVVLDVTGAVAAREGAAELQGKDRLLLRPSGRASFSVRGLPPGPIEIEVTQVELGGEDEIALGGALSIDGEVVARLAPSRSVTPRSERSFLARAGAKLRARLAPKPRQPPPDRVYTEAVRAWLHGHTERIVLDAGPLHARVARFRVRGHALVPAPALSEQLRIAEALRVCPGEAVAESDLPTIAVVIPTFDGRAVLGECLASLGRARYAPGRSRIIVVDNGSSDGTIAHLRRAHAEVEVIALQRNHGFAAACNRGARAAGGAEVIVFLNNDMRVEEDFLAELTAPLARRECKATVAKRLSWDGTKLDGAGVGSTFAGIAVQPGYGAPPGPEHDVPRRTLFPCGGAMAIDAATFHDVGGFDEEFFAYYEDLDLGWRMWVMGHATHYVPSAIARHHHSHTSRRFPPAALRRVMIRNSLLACVKNYDDANLARVLPVVIALAARRAWLASALDTQPLCIEEAKPEHLAPSGARATDEAPMAIRALGAADLAALDDLLGRFEHWLARRREVQARRALADSAIFPLFLEPLACVEGDAGYQALQRALLAMYGVSALFESNS